MVCYKPLKAWPVGLTNNNKTKYHITSYEVHHIEVDMKGIIKSIDDNIILPTCDQAIYDYKEIPCGHCIGCRLDYSRQWADRCLLEMKQHKESYFVTLTYDDEHLPKNEYVDTETGCCGTVATLDKKAMQLFLKRLRKIISLIIN